MENNIESRESIKYVPPPVPSAISPIPPPLLNAANSQNTFITSTLDPQVVRASSATSKERCGEIGNVIHYPCIVASCRRIHNTSHLAESSFRDFDGLRSSVFIDSCPLLTKGRTCR